MTDIGNAFYVLQFSNPLDYETALLGGPWLISDQYLTVQRWRPHFDWEKEMIKKNFGVDPYP